MPRKPRSIITGGIYHIANRGNDRHKVFRQRSDYERFIDRLDTARQHADVKVYGYCLMPNHFHLIVSPQRDGAISEYAQRVWGRYSCEFRARTKTVGHGHVFKGRFWDCHLHDERYFLSALRYVESNPLRAALVARAEEWLWSSFVERLVVGTSAILSPPPVPLPHDWNERVNQIQDPLVLMRLRRAFCPPRR
jgi:putative transposase